MGDRDTAVRRLENRLQSGDDDVYVPKGAERPEFLAQIAQSIREHLCEPFQVSAAVVEPGFNDIEMGTSISGLCLARNAGYWLVYEPLDDRFYAFWGPDENQLQAPGISGGPLYCWSA